MASHLWNGFLWNLPFPATWVGLSLPKQHISRRCTHSRPHRSSPPPTCSLMCGVRMWNQSLGNLIMADENYRLPQSKVRVLVYLPAPQVLRIPSPMYSRAVRLLWGGCKSSLRSQASLQDWCWQPMNVPKSLPPVSRGETGQIQTQGRSLQYKLQQIKMGMKFPRRTLHSGGSGACKSHPRICRHTRRFILVFLEPLSISTMRIQNYHVGNTLSAPSHAVLRKDSLSRQRDWSDHRLPWIKD